MSTEGDGFAADELRMLLSATDRHLRARDRIVLIGGSAASLAHGATATTDDIDAAQRLSKALESALQQARDETALDVPVSETTIADFPQDYEGRLVRCMPELKKLEVYALDKHDLALSKAVRCDDSDLRQLVQVHLSVGLDFATLVSRFQTEMGHATGSPAILRERFLTMIKELFGEMKMVAAQRQLTQQPGSQG